MGLFRRHRRAIAAAALGSAAIAALVAYSRREVERGEAAFPPSGRILELSDGARMHVVDEGEGTPLVIVHGADGVALSFTETVTAGLSRDHRSVAMDRPGHGWSTLPPHARADVATNARLVREASRALGLERPIVVGHSYGATVAMAWALDHPAEIRALVLLAPVAAFPWRAPAWALLVTGMPLLGIALTEALVVPIGRLILSTIERRAFSPAEVPERYAAYSRALYVRPSQFRVLAAEYAHLRADVRALAPRFGEIDVPVEIVAADGDVVARPRSHAEPLASAVPGARLTMLEGAGHEFMWERPEAILQAVRRAEERSR